MSKHQMLRPEDWLAKLFKRTPQLPQWAKTWIVKWLPWGSFFGALLAFSSVWTIWQLLHAWAPAVLLLLEALLYLLATPSLHAKHKQGWDCLFYAAIINVFYGCSVPLTRLGSISTVIGALLSTTLTLYLLYQIRGYYTNASRARDKR